VTRESVRVFAQTRTLIDRYPKDPGVLVTLLNHVVLAPGEALFIAAGMTYAYTSGFGVEIMAAPYNVLRAGLTPKHVDIPEVLAIANFTPVPPPLWFGSIHEHDKAVRFAPPVDGFELVVVSVADSGFVRDPGPMTIVCLASTVTIQGDGSANATDDGQSVFVCYDEGSISLSGDGGVAIARAGG
jgi:mannose-6-phosphate isomerase